MAIQAHKRPPILVPTQNAYETSYYWSTAWTQWTVNNIMMNEQMFIYSE